MVKKERWIVGIIVGVFGCLLTWILMGNPPPFENPIPFLGLLWRVLHIHLYLILLAIDPPSYLEDLAVYLLVFIQWFIIGRLGCWIFQKFKRKNPSI